MAFGVVYRDVSVPLGGIWSSPFARWGGTLAGHSSLDVAVAVTDRALDARHVDRGEVDGLVLGWTVPQPAIFYGGPTVATRLGMPAASGPMISQACATSVAALHQAAGFVESGAGPQLVVVTDRTSNGPRLEWPNPSAPDREPVHEDWVRDSFARDPSTGEDMLATAENVAAECGFTRGDTDELAVLRSQQYERSLADDRAFQRRYMVDVVVPEGDGGPVLLTADEGVRAVEPVRAGRLPTVRPGGAHTAASQTHPADGAAGALVTTGARARELSGGRGHVRLLAAGFARVAPVHMPRALVPAARAALQAADLDIGSVAAVTTHNPFAVNDLYFARETGVPWESMNAYGCSLVFGHPQGPTGMRSLAELVEELRMRGGGLGLFAGCAAGDTAAALVVEVTD
ncbi:thiolase family protein [Streptomyces sp. NPDC052114]|uniref:thiolase family protein n=1 Tax=unclassified Streptomyces TaxID=2593676 RepID=UPI00344547F6